MFLLKPSSLHQLLLALAIALFSLMVVASPVGTTPPPEGAPPTDKFDIQYGRKQTGSEEWLPNTVNFAKDQEIILFIGKHLLRFQALPEPHIIHEEQITLPDMDHLIQLGPKRRTQLSITIRPDEAKDFWALMVDLPELKKKVGWTIKDDLSYHRAVRDVLTIDPKWGRITIQWLLDLVNIDMIQTNLRNNRPMNPMLLRATPRS
ncbi:hypothetical protein F5890DRAFT_889801 [Lentinula detonsa]|uniref:Uncharacterized protein n=1 Tax=Lentinula detonsa TaxID=2804962 RepID=A0AA38PQ18_9AGAR|nr:hypothetical protein F5890DRAFT_889801 [Lentinula detonsa]